MDYRLKLGFRFIVNEKSSFIPPVIAIAISILFLQIATVNLFGIYNGSMKTLVDYQYGHVYITRQNGFITKSDFTLVHWLDRIPYVEGSAPRISTVGTINYTSPLKVINDYNIQIVGVQPLYDIQASTLYQYVEGHYVMSREDIVLGSIVAKDLGWPKLGETVQIEVTDSHGKAVLKRLTVVGISHTPGSRGLDNSVIMHIDTLRELLQRIHQSQSIIVRLNDPSKEEDVKDLFLAAFPSKDDKFRVQTVEDAAEQQIKIAGSNNGLTYLIAHFGVLSPSPVIVIIMMKQIALKRKDVGLLRTFGATGKDIYLIFLVQAMVIGGAGIILGDIVGITYTVLAGLIHLTYDGSIPLDVQFDWQEMVMNDLLFFTVAVGMSLNPLRNVLKIRATDVLENFLAEKTRLGIRHHGK